MWLDQLPTTGGVADLPTDKLTAVLDAVGAAVDAVGGASTLGVNGIVYNFVD